MQFRRFQKAHNVLKDRPVAQSATLSVVKYKPEAKKTLDIAKNDPSRDMTRDLCKNLYLRQPRTENQVRGWYFLVVN